MQDEWHCQTAKLVTDRLMSVGIERFSFWMACCGLMSSIACTACIG